jgi:hypothetical protein
MSSTPKQDPVAERTKQIQDCMGREGLTTKPRGQLSGSTSAFEASGTGGKVTSYVFVFDSPQNAQAAQKAIFAELDPRGAVGARTSGGVVIANTLAAADHQPAIDGCLEYAVGGRR